MIGKTHKAVIINGEDVLLLGHHVAEAATRGVLEGDARGPWTQKLVDVIAVVELIVKARRNLDGFGGVTILNNDQMVRLKEWPPHLKKVKVPYGGDHNVKLIFQWRWWCHRSISHCNYKVKVSHRVSKREREKRERGCEEEKRKSELLKGKRGSIKGERVGFIT